MALTTPYLVNIPIKAFDSTQDKEFEFMSIGGSQVVKNELEIQDNDTNLQVYLKQDITFQLKHNIVANTLINGKQYKVRVRTYDINNNVSEWSRWELFRCYSTPQISVTNLGEGLINSTNYEFKGSYTQLQGEEIESYKFFLYDMNDSLIAASTQQYSSDIKHSFSGLKDDGEYKIELTVETLHGMVVSTGKLYFRVNYITPQIGAAIILENIHKDGTIKITSNIIDIVGKSNHEVTYIDGEMADLRTNGRWIKFDEGFSINKDFTLKLWCKDLRNDNTIFLEMYGEKHTNNTPYKIQLSYHLNRIHLYKIISNQRYYLYSQELSPLADDLFYIWIQKKDNLIDLKCDLVKKAVI